MLDFLFGFNARLKRLQYLLVCIALVVALFAISLALAASGSIHVPRGSHFTWQMSNWLVAAAVALFVLAVVSIQAMRVRDIGWDPVVVMAGWFTVGSVDAIVAAKMPDLALVQGQYGTMVGLIVDLAMTGILFFWPSSDA